MRYDDIGNIVGALFHYYDNRISPDPLFTIRVQNGNIYEYDHEISPKGKLIGKNKSIGEVEKYFVDGVAEYLNKFLKERIMNESKKITGDDIFLMCPGLKETMDKALEQCGLSHDSVSEAINTSPFKDAFQNNVPAKKKQAKSEVENLLSQSRGGS
jgi:hypothetical protein